MECRWADGLNSLWCGDYNMAVYWELSTCRSDRLCCFLSEDKCIDNHHSLCNISMYKPVTCVLNTAWHDPAESSLLLRTGLLKISCIMLHCYLWESGIPGPIQGQGCSVFLCKAASNPAKSCHVLVTFEWVTPLKVVFCFSDNDWWGNP